MSRRALMLAVRDVLWSQLQYAQKNCDCTFDGKPHPRAGEFFIAIHRSPASSSSRTDLEVRYGFQITMTQRVNVPFDRIGTDMLLKESEGLDDKAEDIISLVHEDQRGLIMPLANKYLRDQREEWTEAPSFEGDDSGRLVGGDWFSADTKHAMVGVALTLRFGKALRIRRNEYEYANELAVPP